MLFRTYNYLNKTSCANRVIIQFSTACFLLCLVIYFYYQPHSDEISVEDLNSKSIVRDVDSNLKYILMWTHNYTEPFSFLKLGRNHFIDLGCEFNNCFLTNNKIYLSNITTYDAILFHAPEYTFIPNKRKWKHRVLKRRDPRQLFIFVCIESATNYPICEDEWNDYFNWTMTYKLDSDIGWEYIDIRKKGSRKLIGPSGNIKWINDMKNISDDAKKTLKIKSKAVAWFVSNCHTLSKREKYVRELKKELKSLELVLDTYGRCGSKKCPKDDNTVCSKYLQDDYFFYLSFENSFSSDYTTEKLLTALENNALPIVWSGSNHSRFMPPGSYIDARLHSPKDLAIILKRLISNIDEYSSYFKWKNYYTYHNTLDSYETHPLCRLCKSLNDPKLVQTVRIKNDLRSWWNGPEGEERCQFIK